MRFRNQRTESIRFSYIGQQTSIKIFLQRIQLSQKVALNDKTVDNIKGELGVIFPNVIFFGVASRRSFHRSFLLIRNWYIQDVRRRLFSFDYLFEERLSADFPYRMRTFRFGNDRYQLLIIAIAFPFVCAIATISLIHFL